MESPWALRIRFDWNEDDCCRIGNSFNDYDLIPGSWTTQKLENGVDRGVLNPKRLSVLILLMSRLFNLGETFSK